MVNTRVRWLAGNPDGWAGPGLARVVAFDEARAGFHDANLKRKGPPVGPAALIKLDHNGLTVWCFPYELELLEEEAAA